MRLETTIVLPFLLLLCPTQKLFNFMTCLSLVGASCAAQAVAEREEEQGDSPYVISQITPTSSTS